MFYNNIITTLWKVSKNHHLLWCILLEYNSHLGRCKILHKITMFCGIFCDPIFCHNLQHKQSAPIKVIFYIPTLSVAIHITTLFCIGNSHPSGSTVTRGVVTRQWICVHRTTSTTAFVTILTMWRVVKSRRQRMIKGLSAGLQLNSNR